MVLSNEAKRRDIAAKGLVRPRRRSLPASCWKFARSRASGSIAWQCGLPRMVIRVWDAVRAWGDHVIMPPRPARRPATLIAQC